MNKNHYQSTLIQIYFQILDIEEEIETNSFPIEGIQKKIEEIKRIIGEEIEE
jgi:hypothetical protein